MNFRIVTLLEFTFVVAVCIAMVIYIPPIGLMLPSVYASARAVARSVRNGNFESRLLMKTGAVWALGAMYTFGALALTVMLVTGYSTSSSVSASWMQAILAGFVFGYGGIAAGIGALIGQWTGMYVSWNSAQQIRHNRG